jgi:hypothetical protein
MYSLQPILLFANMDVPITKMCLDTSILAKSIMGRMEYTVYSCVYASISVGRFKIFPDWISGYLNFTKFGKFTKFGINRLSEKGTAAFLWWKAKL